MNATRPLRPVVESLELRWLPSGLVAHPAAEVSVLAAKTKVLKLNGTLKGTASLSSVPSLGLVLKLGASGRLAATTYTLNATIPLVVAETPGLSVALTVGAKKAGQHAVLDLQATFLPGGSTLTYTITGGTKFLKGSTGTGTIAVSLPQGPPSGPQAVPIVLTFHAAGR